MRVPVRRSTVLWLIVLTLSWAALRQLGRASGGSSGSSGGGVGTWEVVILAVVAVLGVLMILAMAVLVARSSAGPSPKDRSA